jgi:hypothetical protein
MKKSAAFVIAVLLSFGIMAQVGVGTSTPASSAQLDVSSTNKGFLPPRMTAVQRDSIETPVAGLMVYCTNCGSNGGEIQFYNGSSWRNMTGGSAALPAIGQPYRGGLLMYVLQPGDPGYNANTPHGLIMAPMDQSSGIQWHNGSNIAINTTSAAIGTGNQNTINIINAQGPGSYAAQLCADLVLNGYSDWYLPSLDELRKLIGASGIGGLPTLPNSVDYWTSTEVIGPFFPQTAYAVSIPFGDESESQKSELVRVRAFRSF